MKILVVTENPREPLKESLVGHKVITTSFEKAWGILESEGNVDSVITLPFTEKDVSGLDFSLAAMRELKKPPLMILIARNITEEEEKKASFGFTRTFREPVDLTSLRSYLAHFEKILSAKRDYELLDPLTELLKKEVMNERGREAVERFNCDPQKPFCVFFADLDDFKPINDTYGHDVGDEILKAFAGRLKASISTERGDTCGRFGGEEFFGIAPPEAMQRVLRRMRDPMHVKDANGKNLTILVTVSIGIANMEPGLSWEHLVKFADEAMYEAKKTGKNRMRVHGEKVPLWLRAANFLKSSSFKK